MPTYKFLSGSFPGQIRGSRGKARRAKGRSRERSVVLGTGQWFCHRVGHWKRPLLNKMCQNRLPAGFELASGSRRFFTRMRVSASGGSVGRSVVMTTVIQILSQILLLLLFFWPSVDMFPRDIILLLLYPWVYSFQGLKVRKLKSKLEWLLGRNVIDHKSVVQ